MDLTSQIRQQPTASTCNDCTVSSCGINKRGIANFPPDIRTSLDALTGRLNGFGERCKAKETGGRVVVDDELKGEFRAIVLQMFTLMAKRDVYPEIKESLDSVTNAHANEVFAAMYKQVTA